MPLKTSHDEPPAINLTPMIDVVFNLIIFFVLGTKFIDLEHNIDVHVPKVSDVQALTPAPEKHVVNVFRDGQIALDNRLVTAEELQAELRAARGQYAELGVIVRGDADGAFQNVATVLNACRQAGVSDMGISVRLAKKGS
jgi:biopolymer transport protein ExbD